MALHPAAGIKVHWQPSVDILAELSGGFDWQDCMMQGAFASDTMPVEDYSASGVANTAPKPSQVMAPLPAGALNPSWLPDNSMHSRQTTCLTHAAPALARKLDTVPACLRVDFKLLLLEKRPLHIFQSRGLIRCLTPMRSSSLILVQNIGDKLGNPLVIKSRLPCWSL